MTGPTIDWCCDCGAMYLKVDPRGGSRVICYCKDCQAFARATGRGDILDEAGGSDIYQVAPHQVRIEAGSDRLAALRLTDKGPARWYVTCCGAPVANTWPTRALPFVTLLSKGFSDREALGPVTAQAFRRSATAYAPKIAGGMGPVYRAFARRAALAWITGRWRCHPFFDASGAPRASPRPLDQEARAAAYAEC